MKPAWMTPARSAAAALALLALAACGTTSETRVAPDAPAEGEVLTIVDAWVKAEDQGMTAAFGILDNHTDADVQVVAVSSPAATTMELHETVMGDDGQMIMQEVDAFTVPAGGRAELAPGGDHLMFMGLTGGIAAGDDVDITLTLADGTEVSFVAVGKDYEGANESYEGDMDHGSGDDHDADEHEDVDH